MSTSINLQILAKAYDHFSPQDYPFLRDYRAEIATSRPYLGLRVLHNVHVTLSTLCKIETLIAGGADVTVTATHDLIRSPEAMALLAEAGVSFIEPQDLPDHYDVVLDCCAGLYGIITPKLGAVELTQTGSVIYKKNPPTYPVISVDDSMTKNLENFYGTGDGFMRAIQALIPEGIKNKKFLLFGYGKVGKGVAYYLHEHSNRIVVVEKSVSAIADAVRHQYKGIYYNDFKNLEKELKDTFCVVTATGEKNLLSNLYPLDIFRKVKYLANVGSHDEFGSFFKESDARILYDKNPVNFSLEEPTRIKYLDPIFYLHNLGIDVLLMTPRQVGVYSFPIEKDLAVLRKWSSFHKVDTSLIFDEQSQTFNSSLTQNLLSYIPCYVYWKDKNSVYQGCNHLFAKAAGVDFPSQIVGKTDFDLVWKKTEAELFRKSDEEVMAGDIKINFLEPQYQADGTTKTVLASKVPYFDGQGNIAGVLGIYVDITDRQERERLEIENKITKNLLQEQEKFTKLADKVAHDIRSPLASLLMVVKNCYDIPENERIALREAAISIGDIANNLLSKYQKKQEETKGMQGAAQPLLISALLLQLLTEKKYQYQNLPVKFEHQFSRTGNFSFIKIEPAALKRAVSNVINNSVDAFDQKEGEIILRLEASNEHVKIIIQDNGKGMPAELVSKILKNIPVTEGKEVGHGIGMTQVSDTLMEYHGELAIESALGEGTKTILTFPRVQPPAWIVEEIILGTEDCIIILDDDTSIHGAWDLRFESTLKTHPKIQVKHFQQGQEALKFIYALSEEKKAKVFLLADYELLKQDLHGLQVIESAKLPRSILVTSHYARSELQNQAVKLGARILPKQLASEISIRVDPQFQYAEQVDLVFVDDNKSFVDRLILFLFPDKAVHQYQNPEYFLSQVSKYPKNTKICLDHRFDTDDINGIELAQNLHQLGYQHLYLLSGDRFEPGELPEYLTLLLKDDIENIKQQLSAFPVH